jgi:hypothetical protein
MYGIVNKGMEELVIKEFGQEVWQRILVKAGYEESFFISNESYGDEVTFILAATAAEELNISVPDLLFSFGEFWVLETGKKKYGPIIEAGGVDIKDFFRNLPNLHSRLSLIFPKLQPPEFVVTDVIENGLQLHYYSTRQGLKDFVAGLISGIGKLYGKKTNTRLLSSRDEGADHEIFDISWD